MQAKPVVIAIYEFRQLLMQGFELEVSSHEDSWVCSYSVPSDARGVPACIPAKRTAPSGRSSAPLQAVADRRTPNLFISARTEGKNQARWNTATGSLALFLSS